MKNLPKIQIFSGISFVEKLLFTKNLSVMLKAGITLPDAIEVLTIQTRSSSFKKILKSIAWDIKNGQKLTTALKKHPDVFNFLYINLIEIGEDSGTLEENLEYLATQLAKENSLRKKIQGALLYPAIVLTTVFFVGMGLSLFVLPKLIDLFESMDVELPMTTKILLFFAYIVKDHGTLLAIATIAVIIMFRLLISTKYIKPLWHNFLLSLPIIGKFIQHNLMASFCRNLGIMLKSGLTLKNSLSINYEINENLVFKNYLNKLQVSVNKGKSLESELSNGSYKKISPMAIKMIGVGEKSGKLDEMFIYLGDYYEEEVDNTAKNLSTILEPVILLVVGIIVGFVSLAIISPIYELTGSIQR